MRRIDHQSALGRWTLVRHRPAGPLGAFVREIQGYVEEAGQPVRRRELPSGKVPLILVLDGPGFTLEEMGAAAPRRLGKSFIAGLHTRHAVVGSPGTAFCMQVDFTPVGARRFLGRPLDDLRDVVADLGALDGRLAGPLEDELASLPDWTARIGRLEAVLAGRILPAERSGPAVAGRAWALLAGAGQDRRATDLAGALGCSRKHLFVSMRHEFGLSPDAARRVLRFERAVAALSAGAFRTLAELAQDCGYADQAHLAREVRAFSGEPPSALARRILPDGTGVMDDAR